MRLTPVTVMSVVLLAAVVAPPLSAEDWPRFLGPTGDAKSTETGLDLEWPESGPPLLWESEVGEGYTMPSVSGGRLFEFDRRKDRARLTCREAMTGKELWRREYATDYEDMYGYSTGPRGTPVVDGERVYTYGVEGKLRCHAVRDGSVLWEVDTVKKFNVVQNFFGVGSTPIVEGDLLITMVGGSPADSKGIQSGEVESSGSAIVAFDKMTGAVRYAAGDDLASYSSPVLTTISGRRWGFLFARGGLIGFDPHKGKIDFQYPWRAKKVESVNAANPLVVGDRVFITESYQPGSALLRVRPGGYEVLRKDPRREQSMASHWATPVHVDGTIYGCSGQSSGDAELRAVDLEDGTIRWSKPGLGRSTMIHVQGHLIVLAERGRLYVVRATPEGFRRVSVTDPLVSFPAWSPPVLANGILYVRGADKLRAYDLRERPE